MGATGSAFAKPCRREDAFFCYEGVRYAYSCWRIEADADSDAGADGGAQQGALAACEGDCACACDAMRASGRARGATCARPVVLVHGFAQSRLSWEAVAMRIAALAPESAVYALDLAGHGDSGRPESSAPYGLRAQSRMLAAFIRSVPFAQAAVVGYSMGGRVALEMACSDPGAISALVLESAGVGPGDEGDREAYAVRNGCWARRLREEGIESFAEWWGELPLFASQRALPADVRERIAPGRMRNDPEALARTLECAGAHEMRAESENIAALRALRAHGVDVCYIAGACDEKYARVAYALERAEAAQTVIVEGAGHNVHLERPEEFVRLALR